MIKGAPLRGSKTHIEH